MRTVPLSKSRPANSINHLAKLALMGKLSIKRLSTHQKETLLSKLIEFRPAFEIANKPLTSRAEYSLAWLTKGKGVQFEKEIVDFDKELSKLLRLVYGEERFKEALIGQSYNPLRENPKPGLLDHYHSTELLSIFFDDYPIIADFLYHELLLNPILEKANAELNIFLDQLSIIQKNHLNWNAKAVECRQSKNSKHLEMLNMTFKEGEQQHFSLPPLVSSTASTTLMLSDGSSVKTTFHAYQEALVNIYDQGEEVPARNRITKIPINNIVKALKRLGLSADHCPAKKLQDESSRQQLTPFMK